MINEDGSNVANPEFPFKLVLKPTDDIRNMFPSTIKEGNYRVYED